MSSSTSAVSALDLFRETGALLDGHFILRSGLHSRQFFQCAMLLQNTGVAADLCGRLAEKARGMWAERVISPALGGVIVGHEVARALGLPHIFAEKEEGRLVLRRGFAINPGDRFLVVEDVVTRGGRVQETLDIVRSRGGVVVGVVSLVDRSGGNLPDFGAPFESLVRLDVETFEADQVPADLAGIPAAKPGSK
jgi:orotate phosphoribosyltransferase